MTVSNYLVYALVTVISCALGFSRSANTAAPAISQRPDFLQNAMDDSEYASDSSQESIGHISVSNTEDLKLVLIVRTDLGMSTGKIAAQTSHATLACYKALAASNPALVRKWERLGHEKTVLQCSDEESLLLLQAQARSLNLCARTIQDAGRTQIAAGSTTCLGIGPGPATLIDEFTVHLETF